MKTSKPISTISFNTTEYLKLVLVNLLKANKISFWFYIKHKPEDDESGKKEHHHVYIIPSKMIQTDDLKDEFIEYDPSNPDHPRKTLLFKISNFDNAYLYFIHDKHYLTMKGQSRKYHYSYEDIVSSDDDELYSAVKSIDLIAMSPYYSMEEAQRQGLTFEQYFRRGTIPLPQLLLYQRAWDLLLSNETYRNGKENHAMDTSDDLKIDTNTGELIE